MVDEAAGSERPVEFQAAGLTLEGMLHLPAQPGLWPGVVVCHPHPLYGGDMYSTVVEAIARALAGAGVAALRFNFRGVGRSEGEFSRGEGEREDVRGALAALGRVSGVDVSRIGLAGYSFGAMVGGAVALDGAGVQAVALVSPPGRDNLLERLEGYSGPKLVLYGSLDQFASLALERLARREWCEVVAGVDHFWSGRENDVGLRVARFFSAALGARVP